MGRRKGSGNRNGKKPWEIYGIAESTYYLKLRKGLIPDRDRKETESIFLSEKKLNERFSGASYENPPEKIKALREKYKNGITDSIWNEIISSFGGLE